jgi:dTDP-4-amino-4,6-dideoxygalactose transaminase
MKYRTDKSPVKRDRFIEAVKAELALTERREGEGVKVGAGYVKPLYLQPLYQQRIAYGKKGYPWTCGKYEGRVKYDKGICPVAEMMHEEVLITHELMHSGMTKADLDDVFAAFKKVWENIEELK